MKIRFLMIDDSPGRYEEFTWLLHKEHHSWVITFDGDHVDSLLKTIDVILLDHDMPVHTGVYWATVISNFSWKIPVIITSTTSNKDGISKMIEIFTNNGITFFVCPADHQNCEIEWLAWAKGVTSIKGK
jgi:DNA-binding response OmpR family regulator